MTAIFATTIYLRVQREQVVGRLNGHGLREAVSLTDLPVFVGVVIGRRGEGSPQLREHVILSGRDFRLLIHWADCRRWVLGGEIAQGNSESKALARSHPSSKRGSARAQMSRL